MKTLFLLLAGVLASAAPAPTPDLTAVQRLEIPARKRATVHALHFTSDGRTLISQGGFTDGAVRIWDAQSGTLRLELAMPDGKHDATAVRVSPDGTRVVAGAGQRVHLLDAEGGRALKSWTVQADDQYSSQGRLAAMSADGALFAFADGSVVRLHATKDGRELGSWKTHPDKTRAVSALGFSPDGAWLAAGGYARDRLSLVDLKTLKHAETAPDPCAAGPSRVFWTDDAARLLSVSGDGVYCAWAPAPGGAAEPLVTGVPYSGLTPAGPSGEALVWSGSQDGYGTLRLHDGQGRARVSWRARTVSPHAVSRDGASAAFFLESSLADGTVALVDLASGLERWVNPGSANVMAFSPDGSLLVEGAYYTSLVDVATGRRRVFRSGRSDYAVAFTPDGRGIALGDIDGNVTLYAVAPAPPPTAPRPTAPARLSVMAEPPEGRVTAGSTATVRLLLANEGAGAAHLVRVAPRLTAPTPGALAPRELTLETLAPGATKALSVTVPTMRGLKTGKVGLVIETLEANGFDAEPVSVEFEVQGFEPPRLELAGVELTGGGPLKSAESVEAVLLVRNAGAGAADRVAVSLQPGSPDIFLEKEGPVAVGVIGPGETKRAAFRFFVNKRYAGAGELPITATATESLGRHGFKGRSLRLALGAGAPAAASFATSGAEEDLPDYEPKRLAQIPADAELRGLRGSRDARWLGAGLDRHSLAVFDLTSLALKARWRASVVSSEHSYAYAAGFMSDGVLAGFVDNSVVLLDPATGKGRVFWNGGRARYEKRATGSAFQPWQIVSIETINAAAVSPDGRRLFVGGCYDSEEEALLFDYPSDKPRALPGAKGCVRGAQFSPDGAWLAFVREGGLVEIWDPEAGQRKTSFRAPYAHPSALAWLADSRTVAVGAWQTFDQNRESTLTLWDAQTGARVGGVTPHDQSAYELAASPDGRWLLYGGGNDTAVYELAARAKRGQLPTGYNGAYSFLSDGRLAVAQGTSVVLYGLTGGKTAAPKPVAPAKLTASVALVEPSGDRRLAAGEKAELVVKVTNAGPGKAHGLRVSAGLVEPVAGLKLPETVLAGDLSPGGSLERRLPLTGLVSLAGGKARVRLSAREANGFDAPDALIEFETVALKAPRLEVAALSVGGAGVVKPAEVNKLSITLRNAGEGPAQAVVAELVPGDADVFPAGETRRELGVIAAGESRRFDFEFFVNARFKGKALPVALTVSESLGRFGFSRRGLGLVLGQAPDAQVVTVQGRDQAAAATASDDVDEPPLTKAKADPDALAVVIGIERYRQAGLPGVDHAGRDARAVHAYLTKSMGVDPRNAVLLLDEGAAKGDLDKYLGPWLKNRANSRSRVFVFFAGHGAPDAATGEAYLVPFDGDPAYTKDTAFPLRRLYDSLKELPAKDATVLLDSCFSGQGGRSLIAKGTRPLVTVRTDLAVGGNTAALAASGPGQISSSYDAAGHGLMTYHLLRGLRGGADADRDGRVTFGELADFVGPEVEREARLSNVEQTPQTLPAREELGARAKRVLIELR